MEERIGGLEKRRSPTISTKLQGVVHWQGDEEQGKEG